MNQNNNQRGSYNNGNQNQNNMPSISNSLAEEAFLSHLLTEPAAVFNNELISLEPEDFYDPRNQLIYEVAFNLNDNYEDVNIISIVSELTRLGKLHEAGGLNYLTSIVNPANVSNFGTNPVGLAVIIQDEKTKRDLYYHSLAVSASVTAGSGLTSSEAVEEAENTILSIVNGNQKGVKTSFEVDSIVDNVISGIRDLADRPEGSTPNGVPSGFDALDEMTAGFKGGQFIIIAARPGVGKALDVNTLVRTQNGLERLKNITTDHKILGRNGNYYPILLAHDEFTSLESYELVFECGASITADANHIWVAREGALLKTHKASSHLKKMAAGSRGEVSTTMSIYLDLLGEIEPTLLEELIISAMAQSEYKGVANENSITITDTSFAHRHAKMIERKIENHVVESIEKTDDFSIELESYLRISDGDDGYSMIVDKGEFLEMIIRGLEGTNLPGTKEYTSEELYLLHSEGIDLTIPKVGSGRQKIISIVKLTEPKTVRCLTVGSPDGTFCVGEWDVVTHNSTLAVDFSRNATFLAGKTVLFFSLEMGEVELTTRILSAEARVESSKLKHGNLNDEEWAKISEAREKLKTGTFIIDVNTEASLSYIRSVANKQKLKPEGLDMIVIDYLQLMSMKSYEGRQQAVSDTSRGLKLLAKALDVPIIVLSQLNRKVEERTGGRPMISDLRESGSLEQDADMVLMLSRPEMSAPDERPGQTDLIVAKHRGGETGDISLTSMLQYSKFVSGSGMIEITEDEVSSLGIDGEDVDEPW